MKFTSIVALATGALAATVRRDVPEVTTDITSIINAVSSLDSAIKGFQGTNDVQSLLSASGNVVTAINKANSDAGSIAAGSITTSTPGFNDFLTGISNLVTAVKGVTGDLTSRRSTFANLGLCDQVLGQIQNQQRAAATLQSTLISKITAELAMTANTFASQITAALSAAATSYQNCPASPNTSSSGTNPTSSAPTSTVTTPSTSTGSTSPESTSCPESTTPAPPAYTSSTSSESTSCPESSTPVPPAYTSSAPAPPAYTSSVPLVTPPSTPPPYISVAPSGTAPWTPIVTPSTNGTVPPPSVPTVVPNQNAGVKQAAGFGGLLMAVAAIAVAAF